MKLQLWVKMMITHAYIHIFHCAFFVNACEQSGSTPSRGRIAYKEMALRLDTLHLSGSMLLEFEFCFWKQAACHACNQSTTRQAVMSSDENTFQCWKVNSIFFQESGNGRVSNISPRDQNGPDTDSNPVHWKALENADKVIKDGL